MKLFTYVGATVFAIACSSASITYAQEAAAPDAALESPVQGDAESGTTVQAPAQAQAERVHPPPAKTPSAAPLPVPSADPESAPNAEPAPSAPASDAPAVPAPTPDAAPEPAPSADARRAPGQAAAPLPNYQQPPPPPALPPPVPQPPPAGGVMTHRLPYVDGEAAPAGYESVSRLNRGLVVSGWIVFAMSHGLSLIEALAEPDQEVLAVPVLGPLIHASNQEYECTIDDDFECDNRKEEETFLAWLSLSQLTGVALLTVALLAPKRYYERVIRTSKLEVSLLPLVGPSGVGLSVAGRL